MDEFHLFESAIKEFGPLVALIAYYIWRDFLTAKQNVLREARMGERINQLEDFQRGELSDTLKTVTKVMADFTVAVKSRPCLLEQNLDFDDDAPRNKRR